MTTDSPEAFEEIIWMAFWKKHYKHDRIRPWLEVDKDFMEFLRNHMRKIIALHEPRNNAALRYLSKNNLNIARTGILAENFPDAAIIVPFRDPLQHAASLLRQHRNFLEIHRADRFARQYMAGIGHFDFGENLRPIDFDSWLDRVSERQDTTLGFWLEYWYQTYSHLLKQNQIQLFCYEDLCNAPADSLARLADILLPDDRAALLAMSPRIQARRLHEPAMDPADRGLLQQAMELYQLLRSKANR